MSVESWVGWKPVAHTPVWQGKEAATPFGSALRKLRVDRRLSQFKLAKRSGISHSTASRLESGARQPSREMIAALADALDATEAERDELLTTGGFMPLDVGHLIGESGAALVTQLLADPDVALVARLLADPGVSAGRKERVRQGISVLVAMATEG